MRLKDFQILAQYGFSPAELSINRRLIHIFECVRLDLLATRVEAPFVKIAISLVNGDNPRLAGRDARIGSITDIAIAEVPSHYSILSAEYGVFREHVFGCVDVGLVLLQNVPGWRSVDRLALSGIVRNVRSGERICRRRLSSLSKRDAKRDCRLEVDLTVTETEASVIATVSNKAGTKLIETVVAHRDVPDYVEDFFPAKRTRVVPHGFDILDKRGEVLSTIELHLA